MPFGKLYSFPETQKVIFSMETNMHIDGSSMYMCKLFRILFHFVYLFQIYRSFQGPDAPASHFAAPEDV
jgi:hypothetical protein